jgi:hypothetical protein
MRGGQTTWEGIVELQTSMDNTISLYKKKADGNGITKIAIINVASVHCIEFEKEGVDDARINESI